MPCANCGHLEVDSTTAAAAVDRPGAAFQDVAEAAEMPDPAGQAAANRLAVGRVVAEPAGHVPHDTVHVGFADNTVAAGLAVGLAVAKAAVGADTPGTRGPAAGTVPAAVRTQPVPAGQLAVQKRRHTAVAVDTAAAPAGQEQAGNWPGPVDQLFGDCRVIVSAYTLSSSIYYITPKHFKSIVIS